MYGLTKYFYAPSARHVGSADIAQHYKVWEEKLCEMEKQSPSSQETALADGFRSFTLQLLRRQSVVVNQYMNHCPHTHPLPPPTPTSLRQCFSIQGMYVTRVSYTSADHRTENSVQLLLPQLALDRLA